MWRVYNRHAARLGVARLVEVPFRGLAPQAGPHTRRGTTMSEDFLVETLLRHAPDSWTDTSLDANDAVTVLTAAGFVERRITFTVQLPGEERVQRITIETTGEHGLAEAMEAILHDWWARWGGRWQELRREIGGPIKPIIVRESDQWRLTDQGRLARADFEKGDKRPIDFALKRGFFDGKLRRLPNGRITRREPVRGYGRLVSIENASSGSLAVSISNWPEGSAAFAKAFAKALDVEPRVHQRRPWPGANSWSNWGVGLDDAANWHLFHFRREGTPCWMRHAHADLKITRGRLDNLARQFVEDGEVFVTARSQINSRKSDISRLRKAIKLAVHGEGIFPHGDPIPFDYEHQSYRPVIRFGRVTRSESGQLLFHPT